MCLCAGSHKWRVTTAGWTWTIPQHRLTSISGPPTQRTAGSWRCRSRWLASSSKPHWQMTRFAPVSFTCHITVRSLTSSNCATFNPIQIYALHKDHALFAQAKNLQSQTASINAPIMPKTFLLMINAIYINKYFNIVMSASEMQNHSYRNKIKIKIELQDSEDI